MNIFYLHEDPIIAAQMQCDKHVVKMILESAQMLSTAHHLCNPAPQEDIYKATHKNHPSNVWVRSNKLHYRWLWEHFVGLSMEYLYRYNRQHLSYTKMKHSLWFVPENVPLEMEFAEPPLCMPDGFKSSNAIESYREYYKSKNETMSMKWTKRDKPDWFEECNES